MGSKYKRFRFLCDVVGAMRRQQQPRGRDMELNLHFSFSMNNKMVKRILGKFSVKMCLLDTKNGKRY